MLDNEPNATQTQDPDAIASSTPPASAAAAAPTEAAPARKRTARKRTAKKAPATETAPDAAPAGTDESTQQPAPVKKTAKRAAKKTAAKRASKKAVEVSAETLDQTATDLVPETGDPSGQPPAKKTSRKRASKKSVAAEKLASPAPDARADAGVDGGPHSEAERETTRSRGAATAAVLFQAPIELDEPPRRRTRKLASSSEPEADHVDKSQPDEPPRRRTRKKASPSEPEADQVDQVEEPVVEADAEADDHDGESAEGEGGRRRRRRRGGRRRRKAGDPEETEEEPEAAADEAPDETPDETSAEAGDEEGEGAGTSRRRRRRRRRKGEDSAASPDDPDETVVRVREPRSKGKDSEITAVEGSTRLEAKKQRRREGRAAGRRRAPIVSEAEFLARRESVERTMVIRARDDLTQIAVSEDNVLVEHYVAQAEQTSLIGNVYLGRVQNVLPSMEAAFIDIGKGRNAVLYAGEVDWATLGATNGQRKIESVLKSGQAVLVQVTKDPVGHKGARLTNQISLPGRYVVYVPRGGNGGISRKLPDTERNRLKGILKDIVPDEAGVIVRTAAEGASEEELTRDVSRLKSYWDDIEKKSGNGQAPQLLYGEPDLLIRVVRDLFTEDFTKLVISGDTAYDLVDEYVSYVAPHLADRVEKWTGDGDVFGNFRIDEQIKKALDRKVWLPSGGSLIIDRTEAMTVVDVNTGKFTGSGGNLEETVTRNNLEAAEEIVRQLRLRDIGGIIVVDFIDMVLESNRELVLRRLVECLGRDRTKHQVAEVTSLGLVQMTRKRIGTGLLEAFSETCDHCGGRGLILHDEPREPRRRAQAEEPAKKTSSRRGKGRKAKQEPVEEQPSDAAQKLAEIAAATVGAAASEGEPELAATPV